MLVFLFGIVILAQWFLAPLGLMDGVVLMLYACIFVTVALRQWSWVVWSLLMTAWLLLFGVSSLLLTAASITGGIIMLGIFSRYVDVGQATLRTVTLCCVWSVWVISVLLSYRIPNVHTYITTISIHILFILAWSWASSSKEFA